MLYMGISSKERYSKKMLCWTKFNLLSQLLIVCVSHSTFRINTMISLSLPPIYLLMELIVEIDLIFKFFLHFL